MSANRYFEFHADRDLTLFEMNSVYILFLGIEEVKDVVCSKNRIQLFYDSSTISVMEIEQIISDLDIKKEIVIAEYSIGY
ncbi:hypothetical protein [Labilibaculum euxinus]|uniref:Uncharacterized protein n=1 Tax=Labilibaculum euxinus TaxID=2686357 RepID=A0A7M4D9R8_9BACT|nr:hypothetical protein [Labilibaculum euxinus]MUP39397.1 hypothetical protein [Labilibaculum euxinus]MVB08602.1 hypothetical protein [Labilibaculum euxinus]